MTDNFHMLTDTRDQLLRRWLSGGPKRRETAQAGLLIVGAAVVGLRFFPELEAAALVSGVLAAIPEPRRTAVGDGREIELATLLVRL